jgi:hypothetical protein
MNAKNKNKKPRLEAEAAYENAHLVAQDLIACLREMLEDQPAPGGDETIHWGHVGSISHVNELLSQAICFLGGFDEDEV